MKILQKKSRCFTLVELLVAMAVFVVMLALMLRFFSGTQQVWRGLRERNTVFADARTAMDLMTSLLENAVTSDKFIPLSVAGEVNEIRFLTRTPRTLLDEAVPPPADELECIFLVSFSRTDTANTDPEWETDEGVLVLKVSATPQSGYAGNAISGENFQVEAFDAGLDEPESSIAVIKQVSELSFRRLVECSYEDPDKNCPVAIEITLKVFDTLENYQIWKGLPDAQKEAFRGQHEHTFRRVVGFDDIAELIEE